MAIPAAGSFTALQLLTAAQMNLLCPTYAVKSATQTVTNSTALVNDNDLTFTLLPNQTYQIDWNLEAASSAVAHGINIGYALTNTVAIVARQGIGPVAGAAAASTSTLVHAFGFNAVSAVGYGTDTGTAAVWEKTIFTAGASGGLVTLQFAQNTAGAGTTTSLVAGSHAVMRCIA